MWQCARCGQVNEGNLCQRCGLPAYQGDPEFARHHAESAAAQREYAPQQRSYAPPQRRRKRRVGSFVFCLLAIALTVFAALQGLKKNYHFVFRVNTDNMNQSFTAALSFFGIDLKSDFAKLNYDGEYSLLAVYDENSDVNQASSAVSALTQQADTALQYLRNYGLVDESVTLNTQHITALFQKLARLGTGLKILAILLGVFLLLALLLLLLGRHAGARSLTAISALLVGGLPILACALLNSSVASAVGDFVFTQKFGIGIESSLALTASGMLQIELAAAALVCVIVSCITGALAGGKR